MRAITRAPSRAVRAASAALCFTLALFESCGGGGGGSSDGASGAVAEPPPTSTVLQPNEDAPGVVATIQELSGGSGPNGAFFPGDALRVRFALRKHDGSPWGVSEMARATILVSGPSFSYQRVIKERDDVQTLALHLGDGVYLYEFPVPLPGQYLAPLHDTTSFGTGDGELTGTSLLDGTYTVGLSFAWQYTVAGEAHLDVGETTADFLVGDSAVLAHRAVSSQQNCERCHVRLEAHEGTRRDFTLCLLCHTRGAEDANDAFGGVTPGVTISSRVMFHKIHNGRHLPSVLGIISRPDADDPFLDGALAYDERPKPYVLAEPDGTLRDFSDVGFPAWPNRAIPMPRDIGYGALGEVEQALEDEVRRGITSCFVCHGDPDGDGPIVAPAQGDLVYSQPTRAACGACHDDVIWTQPYLVNNLSTPPVPMLPQLDDSLCVQCHLVTGDVFAVRDAHVHPLFDTMSTGPFDVPFNPGLHLVLENVSESGPTADMDETIDPGERISVRFRIVNDAGTAVSPGTLTRMSAVVSGPSANSNLLLETVIPPAALGAGPSFTIDLPERLELEYVGDATSTTPETFTTSRAPHLDVSGAPTQVFVRTASGAAGMLASPAAELQNWVDLFDASAFARDDVIVIDDDLAGEEYLKIQLVDGDRLWFSSPRTTGYPPGLRRAHAPGAAVSQVTLTPVAGESYTLDARNGTITEVGELGPGNAVIVSYTSAFVVPARYAQPENASPDLGEEVGEWSAKSFVAGTYRVGIWGSYEKAFEDVALISTPYTIVSPPATQDILCGSAAMLEPYALISSGANCQACHQDLWFHEGTARGFDTCILCHSTAGSEDLPRYVAASAPATAGVTVNFRTLLHKIHRGKELANAQTFKVVGAGPRPYPLNFTENTFADILFPAFPGRTMHCAKCHGAENSAWIEPAPRDHPTGQTVPTAVWKATCGTCHDSSAALAHIDLRTTPGGVEACAVCHGRTDELSVERAHATR